MIPLCVRHVKTHLRVMAHNGLETHGDHGWWPVMIGNPMGAYEGGSYWLAPLDCHSRVVGRCCSESCVRI